MEIPHSSRDHVVVPDTVKTTVNLNIESTGKMRSIIESAVRALVMKNAVRALCSFLDQPKLIQLTTQIFMILIKTFNWVKKSAKRSWYEVYS